MEEDPDFMKRLLAASPADRGALYRKALHDKVDASTTSWYHQFLAFVNNPVKEVKDRK